MISKFVHLTLKSPQNSILIYSITSYVFIHNLTHPCGHGVWGGDSYKIISATSIESKINKKNRFMSKIAYIQSH